MAKVKVFDARTNVYTIVTADIECGECGDQHIECTFAALPTDRYDQMCGAYRRLFILVDPLPCGHNGLIWLAEPEGFN